MSFSVDPAKTRKWRNVGDEPFAHDRRGSVRRALHESGTGEGT
ncbi:hypothetical protein ACFRIB_51625 [Streptomyces mirabilis]